MRGLIGTSWSSMTSSEGNAHAHNDASNLLKRSILKTKKAGNSRRCWGQRRIPEFPLIADYGPTPSYNNSCYNAVHHPHHYQHQHIHAGWSKQIWHIQQQQVTVGQSMKHIHNQFKPNIYHTGEENLTDTVTLEIAAVQDELTLDAISVRLDIHPNRWVPIYPRRVDWDQLQCLGWFWIDFSPSLRTSRGEGCEIDGADTLQGSQSIFYNRSVGEIVLTCLQVIVDHLISSQVNDKTSLWLYWRVAGLSCQSMRWVVSSARFGCAGEMYTDDQGHPGERRSSLQVQVNSFVADPIHGCERRAYHPLWTGKFPRGEKVRATIIETTIVKEIKQDWNWMVFIGQPVSPQK